MGNCRLCGSINQYRFLDLGFTPLADQFRRKEQLKEPSIHYPLEVYVCENCGFIQLGHVVSPEVLYKYDYPYESSVTQTGVIHYHTFAKSVIEEFGLKSTDLVIDIGSNVGVLLEGFKKNNILVLGVDPASNIVNIANKRGIETIEAFFSIDIAKRIVESKGQASIITATNVFAHIDDLNGFTNSVKYLLNQKGVLIIEAPHFLHLINNMEYDTIYHEHLSYITIEPLVHFFEQHGMEIIKVEQKDIHGGSIRIFIASKGCFPVQDSVNKIVAVERTNKLRDKETLIKFSEKVEQNRQDLLWMLRKLKHDGKKIVAVSAPAKGMTLLNYCKIGKETLDFVTEKSTLKIDRYTPGGHIPIYNDSKLLEEQPDYALLLAWNFADEIIKNNQEFRNRGGKFIIPIPTPTII